MSKKTKCCKKYKRGGKYCRSCPLRRGGQIGKDDSRQMANGIFASVTKIILISETSTDSCSANQRGLYKPGVGVGI